MNAPLSKIVAVFLMLLGLNACTQNQIGTGSGGAAGAGLGYAVSNSVWGAAIGGGAGALVGNKLTKNH